jgi:Putative Actinobacterial Holin-X, holin superfamily III
MAEADQPVAALLRDLSEQTSTLVRKELELARLEMTEKGKRAGIGVGMFGGAGLVGLYALGALIAAAILLLATAITPWLAALVIAAVCGAVAGGLALMGKSKVSQATPPLPEQATESVKEDVRLTKAKAEEARR